MAKEKICGIYRILNTINNKVYIGCSNNIYYRWATHTNLLNRNEHYNKYLQDDWNNYGADNFEFSILERCSDDEKFEIEKIYIDKYHSTNKNVGYNISYPYGDSAKSKLNNKRNHNINSAHRKYTEEQVLQVISLLLNSSISYSRIAEITNTSFRLVSDVYSKNSWNYLTDGIDFPRRTKTINEKTAKRIIDYLLLNYKDKEISKSLNVPQSIVQSIRLHLSWNDLTNGLQFPIYTSNDDRRQHRLVKEEVICILNDYKKGLSTKQLMDKYNVSYNQVYNLITNKTWNNIT